MQKICINCKAFKNGIYRIFNCAEEKEQNIKYNNNLSNEISKFMETYSENALPQD